MKKLITSLVLLSLIIPAITQAAWDAPKLQELGVKMIDKRVEKITKVNDKLAQAKHVSKETIEAVQGELSRVNNELGELKTKIQAETDTAILKADVKSIVNNYRVFQVFLPQSAGIIAVDRLTGFQTKLYEVKNKISEKADELEGQGKDVSAIRNLLLTADSQISAGTADISTAETKFASMQISDPETARSLKLEGRTALTEARKDFSEARKNLRESVKQIKALLEPVIE